jgi:hypothetical protein
MRRWIATLANFFLPGLGYLIAGQKQMLAVPWITGMVGLTYVEQQLQQPMPQVYWIMFASVLIINAAFAVDVFRSFKSESSLQSVKARAA